MTTTATARDAGVEVEVFAGGALSALRVSESATRSPALAETILRLVREATAEANSRAHHLLAGVDPTALGLGAAADETTPRTWRQE
ncbi:YbaB/EbfC family DNA-binding protein [Actinokineospora sp. NBRC 105648]|uniref:YbaB/EbfC family DNA-binding protein n=1 Tax=Actinokineospora sp. NBRC 105648 TaxID=3032206 RepID=UPI0024A5AD0D|nr:YbaB/EbfC family DNA-binding protein [Actinokineospora sp. NBRC 105648]GLZ39193.1 hypothetical protein Acsp05_28170 [Actinokineospora sp. NBRC 105648]